MHQAITPTRQAQGARLRIGDGLPQFSTSVLASLRDLMPRRALRPSELQRIAELQANRLLELSQVSTPAVPIELISELPHIRLALVPDLPVAGAADWVGGRWLLSIAAVEPFTRQRFSIAHEFKHVIDHPYRNVVFADSSPISAHDQAERLADYFAACLLMPKRLVVRLWGQGVQRVSRLAERFEVSAQAMQIRLWQLGLVEQGRRCRHRPTLRSQHEED